MNDDLHSNHTPRRFLGDQSRGRASFTVTAGSAAALGALAGCGGGSTGGATTSSSTGPTTNGPTTIGAENTSPVATTTPFPNQTLEANSPIVPINLAVGFFDDADGDTLTFTVAGLEGTGLSYDGETRRISGSIRDARSVVLTVTASDGEGGTASRVFTLTAEDRADGAAARPMIISTGLVYGRDAVEGDEIEPINVAAGFEDPDEGGDDLTYAVNFTREDSGLSYDPTTGMISGEFSGTENVTAVVTVTNGDGENATSVEHRILFTAESVDPVDVGEGEGIDENGGEGGIGNGSPVTEDKTGSGPSADDREATLGGLFVYQPPAAAVRGSGANVIYAATLSNGTSLESVGLEIDEQTGVISGVFTGSSDVPPEDQVAKGINPKERSDEPEDPKPIENPTAAQASIAMENEGGSDEALAPDEVDEPGDEDGSTNGDDREGEEGSTNGDDPDDDEESDGDASVALTVEDLSGSRGEFDALEIEIKEIDVETEEETIIQTASISFDIEGNPQRSIGALRENLIIGKRSDAGVETGTDLNIDAALGFAGDFAAGADLTYWAMGQDPIAREFYGDDAWRFHLNQIGIEIDSETGMISGEYEAQRDFTIYVTASDGIQFVTRHFEIYAPPVFIQPGGESTLDWYSGRNLEDAIPGGQLAYGNFNSFGAYWFAFSPSGDVLTYSAPELEGTGLKMEPNGWVHGYLETDEEDLTFTLIASRDNGAYVEGTMTIPVNRPPVDGKFPLPDAFAFNVDDRGVAHVDAETAFSDPEGGEVTIEDRGYNWGATLDDQSNIVMDDDATLGHALFRAEDSVGHGTHKLIRFEKRDAPAILDLQGIVSDPMFVHGVDGNSVDVSRHFLSRAGGVASGDAPLEFSADGLDEIGLWITDDGSIRGRALTAEETVTVEVTATDHLGGSTTHEIDLRIADSPQMPSWEAWALAEAGGVSFDASRYAPFVRGLDGNSLTYSAVLSGGGTLASIGLDIGEESGEISGSYTGNGTEVIEISASSEIGDSFKVNVKVKTNPADIDAPSLYTVPILAPDGAEEAVNAADHFRLPFDGTPELIHATVRGDAAEKTAVDLDFDPDTGMISGNFDEDREIYVLARLDGEYYANILDIGPRFNEDRLGERILTFERSVSIYLESAFRNPDGMDLDLHVSGHRGTGIQFEKFGGGGVLKGFLNFGRLDDDPDNDIEIPDTITLTVSDSGGDGEFMEMIDFAINRLPMKTGPVPVHSGPGRPIPGFITTEVFGVPGAQVEEILDLSEAYVDPDGDPLEIVVAPPLGVSYDPDEMVIGGTFPSRYSGSTSDPTAIVTVSDGRGGVLYETIVFKNRENSEENSNVPNGRGSEVSSETAEPTVLGFIVEEGVGDPDLYSVDERNPSPAEGGPFAFDAPDADSKWVIASPDACWDGDYLSSSLF